MSTESCQEVAGKVAPVVNRNRCEGKAECVRVCPYGVFEIRILTAADRKALSFVGKIKAFAHGGKQAYVANASACHACQLCISECPENALDLAPLDT